MFYNRKFVLLIKKIHRLIQHVKNNFTKHPSQPFKSTFIFFFPPHRSFPHTTFLAAMKVT